MAVVDSVGAGSDSGSDAGSGSSSGEASGAVEPAPEVVHDRFRCAGWAYRTTQRACELLAQDAIPAVDVESFVDLQFAGGARYSVRAPYDTDAFRVRIDPNDPWSAYLYPSIRVEWDFGRGTLSDFAVFFTAGGLAYIEPSGGAGCAECRVQPFSFQLCETLMEGSAQMFPRAVEAPLRVSPEDISVFPYTAFIESDDGIAEFIPMGPPREVTDVIFVRRPDACPDWPGPDARFPFGR